MMFVATTQGLVVRKFNPYHDQGGRFSSGGTAGGSYVPAVEGAFSNPRLTWSQEAAVISYAGEGSTKINSNLRTGQPPLNAAQRTTVRNLDKAIAKGQTTEDVTVHRGISGDVVLGFKRGGLVMDRAFVSTSADLKIAQHYATRTLAIEIPKGSSVLFRRTGPYQHEQEAIFGRNAVFRVVTYGKLRFEGYASAE